MTGMYQLLTNLVFMHSNYYLIRLTRHGGWLTFGNVELHLIKGTPKVHEDTDLIVSHLALEVDDGDLQDLRKRLEEMGVK